MCGFEQLRLNGSLYGFIICCFWVSFNGTCLCRSVEKVQTLSVLLAVDLRLAKVEDDHIHFSKLAQ